MSAEKIIVTDQDNLATSVNAGIEKKVHSGRVDINNLLSRVREKQKKENKVNLIFFSFFAMLIVVVGIILSL
jgi:hypothetical protein